MSSIKKIFLFVFAIILLATAGGMFYLQNFYIPEQIEREKIEIYTAKEDIDPLQVVSEDLFEKKVIPKAAYISDYVVDFNSIRNYQSKSTIYKGEPLIRSNLSEEKIDPTNNLLTTIVPKYYDSIGKGDLINVYVLKSREEEDEETGEAIEIFSVENVFLAKKVEKVTSVDNTRETNAGKKVGYSVLVSEEELKRYYAADYSGEILTVKISNPNLMNVVSSLTEFDPDTIIFREDEPISEEPKKEEQ